MSFWTPYSGSDGRPGGIAEADRARVLSILGGAWIRGVANGHTHRYRKRRQADAFEVWAPPTSFLVEPEESARLPGGLEQLGVVLYEIEREQVRITFQTTPGLEEVESGGFEESARIRGEIAAARHAFDSARNQPPSPVPRATGGVTEMTTARAGRLDAGRRGVTGYETRRGPVEDTTGRAEHMSTRTSTASRSHASGAAAEPLPATSASGLAGQPDSPSTVGIREVTRSEVERFWEDGWIRLPGLVAVDLARKLLGRAQELMGPDGDRNQLRAGFDFETSASSQPFRRPSDSDPLYRQVTRSEQLGRNAALLLGRDFAQRFFDDSLLVKLPLSRRPDRGQALEWHSDTNATDRMWIFFWIALDHVWPEQGGVRYLTGSHKLGPLWRGGSCVPLEQAYGIAPRLRSCRMSDPMDFEPGDAVAHCSGVVHGTDANTGTAPRWVHRITYFPADAVYMGTPSQTISERGIQPLHVLDHADFPVVYRTAATEPDREPSADPSASTLHVRRFHGD
jgi:hypothetical protein